MGTTTLGEFLEVAVHGVLYIREIYPAGVFKRHRKYNVPVQICEHPAVKQYVHSALASVGPLVECASLHRVDILILREVDATVVEKFIFDVSTNLLNHQHISLDDTVELEQSFRSLLLKLYTCDSLLDKLPPECTWSIEVHTKQSALMDMQEKLLVDDFMWITADKRQASESTDNHKVLPLKGVSTGVLKMQLYVEEHARN